MTRTEPGPDLPRVVIAGAGFAGRWAARVVFPTPPGCCSGPLRDGSTPTGTLKSRDRRNHMTVTWMRDPASTEGPAILEANHRGATLRVAERGNHWFASVAFPDGRQWSQACRTEEEARTLALRAAEAPRE